MGTSHPSYPPRADTTRSTATAGSSSESSSAAPGDPQHQASPAELEFHLPSSAAAMSSNRCLYDNDVSGILSVISSSSLSTNTTRTTTLDAQHQISGHSPSATTHQKLNKYSSEKNQHIPPVVPPVVSPGQLSQCSSSQGSHSSSASSSPAPSQSHRVKPHPPTSPPATVQPPVAADSAAADLGLAGEGSYVQKHSAGLCLLRPRNSTAPSQPQPPQETGPLTTSTASPAADGVAVPVDSSSSRDDGLGRQRVLALPMTWEALLIRRGGQEFYELPKGHVEAGESLTEAAEREIREETGLMTAIQIGVFLTSERYIVDTNSSRPLEMPEEQSRGSGAGGSSRMQIPEGVTLVKCVSYFRARASMPSTTTRLRGDRGAVGARASDDGGEVKREAGSTGRTLSAENAQGADSSEREAHEDERQLEFGPREVATRELKWVSLDEVEITFLKSKQVREAIVTALTTPWSSEELNAVKQQEQGGATGR